MPSLAAISKGEFLQLFQRCMPPGGWPHTITVANSGGPDSTCLLWHLASLIKKDGPAGLPRRVVSLHVNHQLQQTSDDMAALAAGTAHALNVEHSTSTVSWSKPPYPEFPDAASLESCARRARMRALFDEMTNEGAGVLALGHHADDQVETVIMRSARGSGLLGLAGMRPVRRWGMGSNEGEKGLSFFGSAGMSRWMVRPFLTLPKDRILATCDRHNLEYVVDKTNFQPSLTRRNAIRHALDTSTELPPILDKFPQTVSINLTGSTGDRPSRDDIRETVRSLGRRVDMVEGQVDNILARSLLPTSPSTVILPSNWMQSISDDTLDCLVPRVLRYVSCHPWGSTHARAKGSRASYKTIIDKITERGPNVHPRTSFIPGAGVVFRPGALSRDGCFQEAKQEEASVHPAWRVQRSPPYEKNKRLAKQRPDNLLVDVTPLLTQSRSGDETTTLTYDNRFHLSFNIRKIPRDIWTSLNDHSGTQLYVSPHGPEQSPRVIWRTNSGEHIIADYRRDVLGLSGQQAGLGAPSQSWVHMELVRTLQAI